MFNTTQTLVAALAVAATVSLAFVPTAAQAGGFSIGFSGGEDGVTMSSGFSVGTGFDEDGRTKYAHDEKYYEDGFSKLDDEDSKVHLNIILKGHTSFRQAAHDCVVVKKIKLLIEQMEDTKNGYLAINDAEGVRNQNALIKYWRETRLVEAQIDCAKGII